jgi:hypothetical protein
MSSRRPPGRIPSRPSSKPLMTCPRPTTKVSGGRPHVVSMIALGWAKFPSTHLTVTMLPRRTARPFPLIRSVASSDAGATPGPTVMGGGSAPSWPAFVGSEMGLIDGTCESRRPSEWCTGGVDRDQIPAPSDRMRSPTTETQGPLRRSVITQRIWPLDVHRESSVGRSWTLVPERYGVVGTTSANTNPSRSTISPTATLRG